jgi:hypothetical protein
VITLHFEQQQRSHLRMVRVFDSLRGSSDPPYPAKKPQVFVEHS